MLLGWKSPWAIPILWRNTKAFKDCLRILLPFEADNGFVFRFARLKLGRLFNHGIHTRTEGLEYQAFVNATGAGIFEVIYLATA